MSKTELEAKVDARNDEINFLRVLYAAVRTPFRRPPTTPFREETPPSVRLLVGIDCSLKGLQLPYFRALGSQQGHG